MKSLLSAAVILALLPGAASAAGDAEQGHALARLWCSSCHIVDAGKGGAPDTAPPFADIAAHGTPDQREARAFLAQPHPPMPNLALSRRQIDDIVAYLNSLAVP